LPKALHRWRHEVFHFMAKDPAFLFYSSDFLTGTMTMTDDQVGKYIRLLCLQHQKGVLSEKDMLFICKDYDEDIFSKFVKNGIGYYNERLKNECDRRVLYSESRRKNRLSSVSDEDMNNISKSYVEHMETETETITVNKNKGENKEIPSFKTVLSYLQENDSFKPSFAGQIRIKYDSWVVNGWKDLNGKPIKNWKSKFISQLAYCKETIKPKSIPTFK